jgi:protein-disulfide isomerase
MRRDLMMEADRKDLIWVLVLLSIMVATSTAILLLQGRRIGSLEDRLDRSRDAVTFRLANIESFIAYAVDGTWIDYDLVVDAPSRGSDAQTAVTVWEFADFECPACRSVVPALDTLVTTRDIPVIHRFVHTPIPSLHPQAVAASLGGLCADGAGKFWEYYDAVYANQEELSAKGMEFVLEVATRLDLGTEEFAECMYNGDTAAALDRHRAFARSVGITGTPTFFVDGKRIEGANINLLRAAIARAARVQERASHRTGQTTAVQKGG